MSETAVPGRSTEPDQGDGPRPHKIVHLRRAEFEDDAVREAWQARGYVTMPPVEGHDPHQRCPICSTDEPPECPYCGSGPCLLTRLLEGADG